MDKADGNNVSKIKSTIHEFLELFREILGTDTCYLYLINEEMDDYEKSCCLTQRIKIIRSKYIAEKVRKNEQEFEQKEKDELILPPYLRRYELYFKRHELDNEVNSASNDKLTVNYDSYFDDDILKSIDILKFIDIAKKDDVEGWNINYENRPAKYVLFKELNKNEVILGEGLTAYLVRDKHPRQIYNCHKEIEEHSSVAFSNRNKSIAAQPCQLLLGFPLVDEKNNTIGVLKAENYKKCEPTPEERRFLDNLDCGCNLDHYHYKYTENDPKFKAVQSYIPLLVKLIKSSKKLFQENSYDSLFNGACLLENLKKMKFPGPKDKVEQLDSTKKPISGKPVHPTNYQIYQSTLHLFLVLKRNEYVGYEEILRRVIHYVKGIGTKLGLNEEITHYFEYNLDQFKKHEELLLSGLDRYRDHFMHQFHVFVTGYIIINELGIDNFKSSISESMNWILRNNKTQYEKDCEKDKKLYEISDADVLRIWFLTAFYHDFAYILQKLDQELENFFLNLLGYPFKVKFDWEKLLTNENSFSQHICDLLKFFSSKYGTNTCLLLQNYLNAMISLHDHGVLSALLLIHASREVPYKNYNESLYAALAISLHNPEVYKGLREKGLSKDGSTWISFESFPMAFLLAFCDTAQSFGRLEVKDRKKVSEYPTEFLDIDIVANEKVSYRLLYKDKDKTPDSKMIHQWAGKKMDHDKGEVCFCETCCKDHDKKMTPKNKYEETAINEVFRSFKFSFAIEYYKLINKYTEIEEELRCKEIQKKERELICTLSF
ncbi:hypothetical protein A9239_12555 [Methanosarcina sp. A14]|uniref:GAF domain-containing protein n=2 Tax=Methanosarcina TaxID=2207 RepID=A0A0E3QQ49_METBA|nr:hypothetical protein MSBRM_0410 [Methanosarcina barkeri MS]OED05051.1 hypothetical protein A9239_12555 [Methanosarcina sp. A14]